MSFIFKMICNIITLDVLLLWYKFTGEVWLLYNCLFDMSVCVAEVTLSFQLVKNFWLSTCETLDLNCLSHIKLIQARWPFSSWPLYRFQPHAGAECTRTCTVILWGNWAISTPNPEKKTGSSAHPKQQRKSHHTWAAFTQFKGKGQERNWGLKRNLTPCAHKNCRSPPCEQHPLSQIPPSSNVWLFVFTWHREPATEQQWAKAWSELEKHPRQPSAPSQLGTCLRSALSPQNQSEDQTHWYL